MAEPPSPLKRDCFQKRKAILVAGLGLIIVTGSMVATPKQLMNALWSKFQRTLGLAESHVTFVENRNRSYPMPESKAQELADLLSLIEKTVPPGSTLFVGPLDLHAAIYNDTHLYYLRV